MENILQIKSLAESVSREVGKKMREVLNSDTELDVKFKGTTDVVTETDLWAENHIKKAVKDNFPGHLVVGEETSSELLKKEKKTLKEVSVNGYVWMVDPIDGTANFANKIPHSAVSIGVLKDAELIFGLVYDPFLDEMFTAIKNQGAFLNEKKIKVGNKKDLVNCIVATGFPGDHAMRRNVYSPAHSAFVANARKVRVLGSSAIELCWVACGRLDGFFEYHLNPWDMAGGTLILQEAGGRVGCFLEPEEKFNVFSNSILGTNNKLFNDMLKTIREAQLLQPLPPS